MVSSVLRWLWPGAGAPRLMKSSVNRIAKGGWDVNRGYVTGLSPIFHYVNQNSLILISSLGWRSRRTQKTHGMTRKSGPAPPCEKKPWTTRRSAQYLRKPRLCMAIDSPCIHSVIFEASCISVGACDGNPSKPVALAREAR